MAGLWGKLAGHGDFLALGLDEAARACVVPWLDASLAALREEWGADWGPRFDAMGVLGFWIGPALAGGAAVAGVMAPSRDRVGRRYPLLILGRGEVAPPMLLASGFHAAAAGALAALLATGQTEASAWPQALAEAAPAPPPGDPSLVWARNGGLSGAELLAEILHHDHVAACAGRVHLWTLDRPGAVLTCDGLPAAPALGWLIGAGALSAQAGDGAAGNAPAPAEGEDHGAATALRLEPRFRLGAEEQADSRLVLRSEWVLPEAAARPPSPDDAAAWRLPDPPADTPADPAPDAER